MSKSLALGEKGYRFLLDLYNAFQELFNINFSDTYALSKWWYQYKEVSVNVFLTYLSLKQDKEKIEKLQNFYREFYLKNVIEKPLLSGKEIMKILNIKPSKEVGILKDKLLGKQLTGEIKTKEEAIKYIKDLYYNSTSK